MVSFIGIVDHIRVPGSGHKEPTAEMRCGLSVGFGDSTGPVGEVGNIRSSWEFSFEI